ncbi:MAG: albusnodin/ikarugamycin family macrolactam cyclase [Pseudonocardiales bacterium]|nr:albusnodin/ikarugamycin family macrolactam cyclase [Acidobacteriaceae bacterium]MBV9140549.1 albusnodin/ikarugamycin family macrolactam cyclase [Pseudonocardiales bacterium]
MPPTLVGDRIDFSWLATALLAPDVEPALAFHSAFSEIKMVPAGYWLTINSNSTTLDRVVTWRMRRRTKEEISAKLAETLQAGIAARVYANEKITTDCSGGFDSTTLTLLTLNQIDNHDRLTAIILHPRGVTRGGDFDYVTQLLAEQPKMQHRWIGLDDSHLPFAQMDKIPASDEPAPMTAAYARMSYQFRTLRGIGSEVHLTGDGGDTLFCAPLLYLADLITAGQYKKAYYHAIGWSRVRRVSPWPLLRDAFLATRCDYAESLNSLSVAFQRCLLSSDLVNGVDTPSAGWHDVRTGPWVTELAYHSTSKMLSEAANRLSPTDFDRANQLTLTALRTVGRTARSDIQVAASHGIVLDNPYLDPSVVSTVLSVSAHEWSSPGHFKPLLIHAFPNLLPKSLEKRTTKGSFEIDHYRGVHTHAPLLHNLVDGELTALGLINPQPLHDAIDLAALGLPVNLTGIERLLATEAWLRAVKTAPATAWRIHRPSEGYRVSVSGLS